MQSKFECKNCNAITTLTKGQELKCCIKPMPFHLTDIYTEEEIKAIEEVKITLGKTYENIIGQLKHYSDINEEFYPIVALWIIGTYMHKEFDTYPLLFLNATKGSGKSRLLRLIMSMAWNGKIVIDLREASLFRTAQISSIGIDEFENVNSKEYGTLRTLLNASYKKGTSVERMKKVFKDKQETQEVEKFPLYTPVALANIYGMEEVLSDRCITLIIEKSDKKHITKLIEDYDRNLIIQDIKRTLNLIQCSLCSVVTDKNIVNGWNNYINEKYNTLTTQTTYIHSHTLTTQEQIINDEVYRKIDEADISARNLELFFPLFLIANLINPEVFEEVLKIAKNIIEEKRHEEYVENRDIQLVEFISQVNVFNNNFTAINKIMQDFKVSIAYESEEMNWLSSRWLGRALKRMNLIKEKRRTSRGIEVMVNIEKAKEKLHIYKEGLK